MSRLERTELFLGKEALEKLNNARVAVIGLGGVGGAAAEAILRAGVGHLLFIDGDSVDETNINRQLLATYETVGMDKIEAAKLRFEKIAPETDVTYKKEFYLPENSAFLYDWKPDYIIDAIDTVTSKLLIIKTAKEKNIPVISCMGTGNKMDITKLIITDISKTEGCPLARAVRKELRARGIPELLVVWSDEKPEQKEDTGALKGNRPAPASAIFVPAAAGLILAEQAVKYLINKNSDL